VVVAYVVVTWLTKPWLMGDTVDYGDSVWAYEHGRQLSFWEFGHLFWRPLAWVIYRLFKPLSSLVYADEKSSIILTLIGINWVAGLVCLLVFRALLTRVCDKKWIINLVPIALLFSSAFLDYGQTGSAYVPGLSLSLTAGWILVRDHERGHKFVNALIAGALLALAVCLWFPFVLLVPAMLTLPVFLFDWRWPQLRASFSAGVVSGIVILVAYAVVIAMLRITTVEGLRAWVTAAAHDMNQMRGIPRMLFGFANSFIDLSGEGALFKRYLRHDPFNPVRASDLFRFSLWKLAFAYFFLFCMLLSLLRTDRGRRLIGLLVVDLLPTVIFALFIFEAGDMSRYISTLPLIFLAIGYALCSNRTMRWTKYAMILFIAAAAIVNVRAMSAWTLNERERRVEARISDLIPRLKPESRVATSHLQDELNNFTRDFLFNPINRNGNLRYHPVVALNATGGERWRSNFVKVTNEVWGLGGDMWVSKRLLSPAPRPEWGWVEGDDPRISWTDLYKFFSQFEFKQSAGGDDGFFLLEPTPRNLEIFKSIPPGQ
jgi:general stress protein CsbA